MAEYVIIQEIGKGSYGKVFLAKEKDTADTIKKLVIKEIDLRHATNKDRNAARQEAYLLRNIKHPNVISYRDSFEKSNGFLYIVMVFAEGGDLFKRIKQQRGLKSTHPDRKYVYLEEKQVVEWSVQICMGLLYLHNKRVLHRDLKTQNIFLTNANLIKIGDLGIAKILDTNTMNETLPASTIIGTPYYMSPEIFNNQTYNEKSDMWSFGCCLYELLTLRHAFHAKDINSLVYAVMKKSPPKVPEGLYSKELVELSKLFLNRSPGFRPSANEFLKHSFIKSYIKLFLKNTQAKIKGDSGQSQVNDERPASKNSNRSDTSNNSSNSKKSSPQPVRAKWVKPSNDLSLFRVNNKSPDETSTTLNSANKSAEIQSEKTDQREVPPSQFQELNLSPSGKTLNSTTKLLDKIVLLRKKCLKTLGVKRLSQVYEIIDKYVGSEEIDKLEDQLKAYLGQDLFKEVGIDIWQLKFCEERLFC